MSECFSPFSGGSWHQLSLEYYHTVDRVLPHQDGDRDGLGEDDAHKGEKEGPVVMTRHAPIRLGTDGPAGPARERDTRDLGLVRVD